MNKFVYATTAAIFLIGASSWASPTAIFCTVEGQPAGQSVEIALPSPTLTYKLKYTTSDGKTVEKSEALISEAFVSSYKVPREKCQLQIKQESGSDSFEFSFSCNGLDGYLNFDDTENNGVYFQKLSQFNNVRLIKFSGCQKK